MLALLSLALYAQEKTVEPIKKESKRIKYVTLNDFDKIKVDLVEQGVGSGLDADFLDGLDAKKFARLDILVTFSSSAVFNDLTVLRNVYFGTVSSTQSVGISTITTNIGLSILSSSTAGGVTFRVQNTNST